MSFDEPLRPVGGTSGPVRVRPHGNLNMLRLAVLGLFLLLGLRLGYMQLVNGESYAQRSRDNHIRTQNVLPARGLIYSADGRLLVENTGVYTAIVTPVFLPEDRDTRYELYLRLEELTGVQAARIQQMVADTEARPGGESVEVVIKSHLTREQALMLEEAAPDLPGVTLAVKAGRRYPGGDAFSQVLGYIGRQDRGETASLRAQGYQLNEPVGKAGLEAYYERELRGEPGIDQAEVDSEGHVLALLDSLAPEAGANLRLALHAGLQEYVTEVLRAGMPAASGRSATTAAAVVMDAQTGKVLALVSLPEYDNNIFSDLDDPANAAIYDALSKDEVHHPLLNKAVTAAAPGSTFKLITAAAGLQEGTITPSTGFDVKSRDLIFVGENGVKYVFKDWRTHGYVDLRGALAWSSNQYFEMVACGFPQVSPSYTGLDRNSEVAAVELGKYARAFGLGVPTGLDISGGEMGGRIPSPEYKRRTYVPPAHDPGQNEWFYADTCFMGIGQFDITATPLQIAGMTAAVANGGKLFTPQLVDAFLDPEGNVIRKLQSNWKRVGVSDDHLQVIREGMRLGVVDGAAARAGSSRIQVAGKTGTAEFQENGVTYEHGWFTGYAPYNNPKYVVTVYYDFGVGGDKAAPVAGKIFDYIARELE